MPISMRVISRSLIENIPSWLTGKIDVFADYGRCKSDDYCKYKHVNNNISIKRHVHDRISLSLADKLEDTLGVQTSPREMSKVLCVRQKVQF